MSFSKLFCCPVKAAVAKRERRKEARPGELLDAALALFVEKGFAATKVEEVAARAGVSKGTLFLYFQNKEELFKAVVRQNISDHFKEWNNLFETFEGNSAEMVSICLHSWWNQVGATPASGITKLMMCEAGNFPEIAAFYQQEVVQPGQTLIRRILQRGVDSGEFRSLDIDYAAYSLIAPMIFLFLSRHSGGICLPSERTLEPEKYIASQLAILLHGLSTTHSPKD